MYIIMHICNNPHKSLVQISVLESLITRRNSIFSFMLALKTLDTLYIYSHLILIYTFVTRYKVNRITTLMVVTRAVERLIFLIALIARLIILIAR